METFPLLTRQIIDEDIQIVRATLATISGEVNRLSPEAGRAFHDAMEKIEEAHEEILRSSPMTIPTHLSFPH
jgi:hypothetical protein